MDESTSSALESLRRQYLALLPAFLLIIPEPSVLAEPVCQRWLVDNLMDRVGYQPESGYRRRFWSKLVSVLERGVKELESSRPDDEVGVDDGIYESLTGLMVATGDDTQLPKSSYRTFVYDLPAWLRSRDARPNRSDRVENKDPASVTLFEEQVAIQSGTTGLRTWTASLHLAHHILHNPHILLSPQRRGAHIVLPGIVELGAGTGFLSILLAQLGAMVIATDLGDSSDRDLCTTGCSDSPLERLRANILLNELPSPPRTVHLDWLDSVKPTHARPEVWKDLSPSSGRVRTIVAADVIYDPDLIPPLVATLRLCITSSRAESSGQAIVAATVRNPATLDLFVRSCGDQEMTVQTLTLQPVNLEDPTFWDSALDRSCAVKLFRITPKSQQGARPDEAV